MHPPPPSISPASALRAGFRNNPRPMNSSPSPIIIEIGIPATFGQLGCVDDSHALPEGWMPVFDPDPAKPWSEKLFTRDIPFSGKTLHLVGL